MNEPPQIVHSGSTVAAEPGRGLRYLALGFVVNALFWGIAFYFLKDSPRVYTSHWSVMLVGSNARVSVNSAVNSASAGTGGARSELLPSQDQDIKESYKIIATTDEVRKAAAAKVGMTTDQFGEPAVNAINGSTLVNFEIPGSTPEEAQNKARALHEALQERLNQLRIRQVAEQEAGFENSLSAARKKLEAAQFRLSDYKMSSGLTSQEQVDQLAASIEALRRSRAEIVAQQQDAAVRARQLSAEVNVTAGLAGDAFVLRADPLFQQYVQDYSQATANLTTVSAKFGPNHPIVGQATVKQAAAQTALQERAQALLGRPVNATAIARLNMGSDEQTSTAREDLFKSVVTSEVEQHGLAARVREIDRQLADLEKRLNALAQRRSMLEYLNRDMQIAEAVFSSTLAGLDARKIDVFGSYPPMQIVAEPSLPDDAVLPRRRPLLMTAAIASLIATPVLFGLWVRKSPWIQNFLRPPSKVSDQGVNRV